MPLSTGLAIVFVLLGACKPEVTPVGPGGECFLATDCAAGLVCVEQPNRSRICTDDLSRVTGQGSGGRADAAAEDGGRVDGSVPDGSGPEPGPPDAGSPDTGAPDSGAQDDGGAG